MSYNYTYTVYKCLRVDTMLSLTMLTAFPTAVMGLTLYRIIAILRKQRLPGVRHSMSKGSGLTKFILFECESCCVYILGLSIDAIV